MKCVFIVMSLFFTTNLYSQNKITGIILSEDSVPLSQFSVNDVQNKNQPSVFSDSNGGFILLSNLKPGSNIKLLITNNSNNNMYRHHTYITKVIPDNSFIEIVLTKMSAKHSSVSEVTTLSKQHKNSKIKTTKNSTSTNNSQKTFKHNSTTESDIKFVTLRKLQELTPDLDGIDFIKKKTGQTTSDMLGQFSITDLNIGDTFTVIRKNKEYKYKLLKNSIKYED